MSEEYLLYVKLKEAEALEKSKIFAVGALASNDLAEKHQKEVEMSFWMGKAVAYAEMKMFLEDHSGIKEQIKQLLEMVAGDLIMDHNLSKLKAELDAQDYPVGDTFEDGVNAMKNKLLEILKCREDIVILES